MRSRGSDDIDGVVGTNNSSVFEPTPEISLLPMDELPPPVTPVESDVPPEMPPSPHKPKQQSFAALNASTDNSSMGEPDIDPNEEIDAEGDADNGEYVRQETPRAPSLVVDQSQDGGQVTTQVTEVTQEVEIQIPREIAERLLHPVDSIHALDHAASTGTMEHVSEGSSGWEEQVMEGIQKTISATLRPLGEHGSHDTVAVESQNTLPIASSLAAVATQLDEGEPSKSGESDGPEDTLNAAGPVVSTLVGSIQTTAQTTSSEGLTISRVDTPPIPAEQKQFEADLSG